MIDHRVSLDMNKDFQLDRPEIKVRVGDSQSQRLIVTLFDEGLPYTPPESSSLKFQVRQPNGSVIRSVAMTKGDKDNIWWVIIPAQAFVYQAVADYAYIAVYSEDGTECATSCDAKLITLPGTTDEVMVRYYDQDLEEFKRRLGVRESDINKAEAARVEAENSRVSAEERRVEAENSRVSAESNRDSEEQERNAAEQLRESAESSRKTAEEGRVSAEDSRVEVEAQRVADENQRKADEETRQSNEDTRESNESAREVAELTREASEDTRESNEDAREVAEKLREAQETARKAAEELRASAETTRSENETARESAEDERADAETKRESAEGLRAEAENGRSKAEDARAEAEAKRAESQAANDRAQAKNNADQTANNLAAQGQQRVFLVEDQFDPETGVPTIEGEMGVIYCVPRTPSEEHDEYVEWIVVYKADGSTKWERIGGSNVALPDAVTTEQIDAIVEGDGSSGTQILNATGLSYYDSATKERDAGLYDASGAANAVAQSAATALEQAVSAQGAVDEAQNKEITAAKNAASKAEKTATTKLNTFSQSQKKRDQAQDDALNDAISTVTQKFDLYETITAHGESLESLKQWVQEQIDGLALDTEPKMPDPRELKAKIDEANAIHAKATTSPGDDPVFGTWTTTEDAKSALKAAIDAAQAVYDGYGKTYFKQHEFDDAKDTLQAAIETFKGQSTETTPDLTEYDGLKKRYETIKGDLTVSANGKDVTFGDKWVLASDQQTMETALATAQTSVTKATKQSEIKAACTTLSSAIDAYEGKVKTAAKDTAAIDKAITAANDAKKDVSVSTDGKDLPSGSKYVTDQAFIDALDSAISSAESAKESATKQSEIDSAASDLTEATETFSGKVQTNYTPPENIADASWDDIEQLSALAAESPQDYQKYLGQTKTIDMSSLGNSCTNVTVKVIGIGQKKDPQGKTLGLQFQLTDGLPYQNFTMNSSNQNTGGWRDCLMRTTNLAKVKAAMPAELQAKLKTMVSKTFLSESDFNSGNLVETQDELVLLSQTEVFGDEVNPQSSWTWPKGEGEQFQWYKQHNTANDRIIKNAGGSAYYWWLRSVRSTTDFRRVNGSGNLNGNGASGQYLPCACFSV